MATADHQDSQRQGLRLHCRGVVQGVGFRPMVARLASALGLEGCLTNIPGAVRIELAGPRQALETFIARLPAALPPAARLEPPRLEWLAPPLPPNLAQGCGLQIVAAAPQPLGLGLVAPSLVADRAPCLACLRELRDPTDRRCGYPFISCCDCGPRYSIATAEPFSRAHTTLAGFRLCPACQAEFDDPDNRRFHAETTGCPACGPQLRLLDGDGQLVMDAATQASAPRRGPRGAAGIAGQHRSAHASQAGDPLGAAVGLLRHGRVLALQGVGGFQLLVNASDAGAVARLRLRKRRPHKPFALLVDTPARLAGLVDPSSEERAALDNAAAPIVLLPCPEPAHESLLAGVAPGAGGLGVMLPASPLHLLLAQAFAGPLVATSGNRSGEPLCIDAAEALDRLAGIADAFLVHDRAIARPLDDSLLQLIDGRPALLRRARGYAPHALALHTPQPGVSLSWKAPDAPGAERNGNPERPPPQATRATRVAMEGATAERPAALLALGSDLKSAPALAIGDRLWLAPHLGDLADGLCLERWRIGLSELLERQRGSLAGVAIDAHPQYLSVQLAEPLLARPGPQPLAVAHHRAHGLAVAAEHGLPLPLPALVLDGLGYGGGTVPLWGCELLWLEADGARRLASLRPFPLPGGERAAREPRRSALGLLWAADLLEHPGAAALRAAFAGAERELLLQALATGCNSPWCSSAGRMFDAIASLLNLVQRASHEGHAALLVQTAASRATDHGDAYPLPLRQARTTAEPDQPGMPQLDWLPMLKDLLDDVASFRSQEHCAARFQAGLVRGLAAAIVQLCPSAEPNRGLATDAPWRLSRIRRDGSGGAAVILAGGCFQNRALLEGLIAELRRRNLRPYWAERLPGNDGGLAVGQLLALQAQLARRAGRT